MAKVLEVYKCNLCGNIVEVFVGGAGDLVCCGEAMQVQETKNADSSTEKHVPFIEKVEGGYKVKVGENAAHPMLDNHFIEWIEIITENGKVYRQNLKAGDAPEAIFKIDAGDKVLFAREFCNLHGHWQGKL